jgi:hypothetical protein
VPNLPFKVAPKRQTEIVEATINGETCSIEFPVFGAISTGEEIDIADYAYQAVVYRESSRLTDALITAGTEETEAQRIAIRIVSTRMGIPVPLDAAEQRAMHRHAALVSEMQNELNRAHLELQTRTCTAAIRHRLAGMEAWTDADTTPLPTPLKVAICNFIDRERNGQRPAPQPDELVEEMVETLGKLAQDPSPSSPPTGDPPTGAAADSGPPLLSSAPTPSPSSPPTTSRKRSRKASAG